MNMNEYSRYTLPQNKVYIVILLIAVILRNYLCRFAVSVFVPIFSDIEATWTTMAIIWLTILVLYVFSWKKITFEKHIVSQRLIFLLFISALFYSVFRRSDEYVFKSIIINSVPLSITIVDAAFGLVLACETVCIFFKKYKRKNSELKPTELPQFHNDLPSKTDKFNRTPFANILVEKIISTFFHGQGKEGSFNILINERYGMGKSSFLNVINEECKKNHIDVLQIKPWTVSGADNISKYFLETLAAHYGAAESKLKHLLINYASQLGERISLTFWEAIVGYFKKERTVDELFTEIKTLLSEEKRPLVVFIDDVDRLQVEELFALLNLIRNTADFPNIVYIVAADKKSLIDILKGSYIQDPVLYLQKFFNYELLFPADDGNLMILLMKEIRDVLVSHGISDISISTYLSSFSQIKNLHEIFCCPRDIYRYSNMLSFALDIHIENNILDELYIPDLLGLLIIQYLDGDVYKVLRDYPDYLLSFSSKNCQYEIKKELAILLNQDIRRTVQKLKEQNSNPIIVEEARQDTEINDINDAISHATPSSEKIISELLKELFSDSLHLNSICYESEYFKYFAGNYSKTQISFKDSRAIFHTESDKDYQSEIDKVLGADKEDSFAHQIMRIAGENDNYSMVKTFQRLVYLFDACYSKDLPNYHYPNKISYFKNSQIKNIIQRIFIFEENDKLPHVTTQLAEFKEFIGKVKELDTTAIFLSECRLGGPYHFIFGDATLNMFQDKIRQRFINERMLVDPFNKDNIKSIPMIRGLNEIEWDECFRKLILNSEYPLEWLYRIILIKGSDLCWNYDYYYSVYVDYLSFADIANKYFSGLMSPEIEQDFISLKTINNRNPLQANEQKKHPFIIAAMNWLRSHEK